MIFQEYQEHITEQTLDLSLYMDDNDSSTDFHSNFFSQTASNGFWKKVNIFNNKNNDNLGLIGQLQQEFVEHVLIMLPRTFIQMLIKKDRENTKTRKAPRVAMEEFISNFTNEFTKNGIACSLIIDGSHQKENTQALEQWLNLKELKQTVKLTDAQCYLLGFKELKIDAKSHNNPIAVDMGKHHTVLGDDCSMLVGNSSLFHYHVPSLDSMVKITNNSLDGYVDFITEHIDTISSDYKDLQEEYFDDGYFNEFSIKQEVIKTQDVSISFDHVDLKFSSTMEKLTEATPTVPTPSPTPQKGIISDTVEPVRNTSINLKNKYLAYLNRITTPLAHGLIEIHYHVVKMGSKHIITGGQNIDKNIPTIAKIVANIQERSFTITNLDTHVLEFNISKELATHQIRKDSVSQTKGIATDIESDTDDNHTQINIDKNASHTFTHPVHFADSSLAFTDTGIEVRYINFAITSFNDTFALNRYTLRHFSTGNIIDTDENLPTGGRVYTGDKENKILGSAISSKSALLSLEENAFTLSNNIKEGYSVTLHTAHREVELPFQETLSFSKDEFLSAKNTIGIEQNGVTLLEVSIIQN